MRPALALRALAALVLVALPASSTVAAVKSVKREKQLCKILEAGNYHATTPPTVQLDPTSPTGDKLETDDVEFTAQTRTIARTLDTSFGIRYRLDVPADSTVKITNRITFPRPLKGKRSWTDSDPWSTGTGVLVQHMGWTFVYDWEMAPGEWKMEVLVDDKPGCAITFTVK
jgi:Domain of unknown function (DUF3859)